MLNELTRFFKTLLCFSIACSVLPLLLLSFIVVHFGNALVNYVLGLKYPTLTISKSKKIRTLIDTQRNAGVFHFLLKVQGPWDYDKIKQYYADHLTEVREKSGMLRFPKLRQKLMTCWGHYAWVKDTSSFNLSNHILLVPPNYRGRTVNENNIQDYVSELVTKYIPSDLPQWQVIIIPTSGNSEAAQSEQHLMDHYYVLIKIHHLIIAEEEDLHISEMLMLQEADMKPLQIDDFPTIPKSPNSSYFIRKPVHIQHLLKHIYKLIVNTWNKFIYEYESLESPDGLRSTQINCITQLLSVLLIIAVNVCLDYYAKLKWHRKMKRRYGHLKTSVGGTSAMKSSQSFLQLLLVEIEKRNLSWQVAIESVLNSWHPANIVKNWTKFMWKTNVNNFVMLPYKLYCELMAIKDLLLRGRTNLTSTYCGRLSVYIPMLVYAQMEFFKICYEVYKAPLNIYEELFEKPSKESNILQKKSYSGRKIVSFTKSIDAVALRQRLHFNNELRESDFTLSCLAGSLHDYFQVYANAATVPQVLNTTCRTINKSYFTDKLDDTVQHIGGVIFLQLPLSAPHRAHAKRIHKIVDEIREKQIMIYLASMGQTKYDLLTALIPRVLTKIAINFFSFNFPVTITEIHGETSEFKTIWGQKVEDVLLFRPPQSKTCLSLNIHRFGDKYRLAIMADTQLGHDHCEIARSFEKYMENAQL